MEAGLPRNEYIFFMNEFSRNTYGIIWLSEEEHFLQGIDVHTEKLSNE